MDAHAMSAGVKRRASSCDLTEGSRKRLKEDNEHRNDDEISSTPADNPSICLADDLAQELQCGCCAELVYKPVVVFPCQHFFCGSCCTLWIRNGGTTCPACRADSTVCLPSRILQSMVNVLLSSAPHKARSEGERQQADEVYTQGTNLRFPSPRESSPDPPFNEQFLSPCPHCVADNQWGWRCPNPLPDPGVDPSHAWPADAGAPPGHGFCGHCSNLLALGAPPTTTCELCGDTFCGVTVPGRCRTSPVPDQHPKELSSLEDVMLSLDVLAAFKSNWVEVEIMLEYLVAHRISPRRIYVQIIERMRSQNNSLKVLFDSGLFWDEDDEFERPRAGSSPQLPTSQCCPSCASKLFTSGLMEWWIGERARGLFDGKGRKNCPEGSNCLLQMDRDTGHMKEFNHIIAALHNAARQQNNAQPAENPGSLYESELGVDAQTDSEAS